MAVLRHFPKKVAGRVDIDYLGQAHRAYIPHGLPRYLATCLSIADTVAAFSATMTGGREINVPSVS